MWAIGPGVTVAEWKHNYPYAPKTRALEGVELDPSTGALSWNALEGAAYYWCEINETSVTRTVPNINLKSAIGEVIASGSIAKPASGKYAVIVRACNSSGVLIARSESISFNYESAAVNATPGTLEVDFDASTGKASWCAYSGADAYWYGVDGGYHSLEGAGRSIDFKEGLDELFTSGVLAKKSSYAVSIRATSAPKLPVTFKKKTGKASWKAYAGAKAYFVSVDGIELKYGYNQSMKGAKSKSFKGAATKRLKLSSLKGNRTVYVWARVHKTVNGKAYYSPWSAIWFATL